MKTFKSEELILAAGSAYGQYIPQVFVEKYKDNYRFYGNPLNPSINWNTFSDIYNEYYWEEWDTLLNCGYVEIDDARYSIIHNEDLWLIPEDMNVPEDWYI